MWWTPIEGFSQVSGLLRANTGKIRRLQVRHPTAKKIMNMVKLGIVHMSSIIWWPR